MNRRFVLRKVDEAWRRLIELVNRIDEAAFVQAAKDGWSPKDHLAHLTAWEEFLLAILEKRDRFQSMGVGDLRNKETTDEINDAVFQVRRRQTGSAVRSSLHDTHRRLRAAIESLSDADLRRRRAEFQPGIDDAESGEETVLNEIEWNTWGHYEKHIAWLSVLVAK